MSDEPHDAGAAVLRAISTAIRTLTQDGKTPVAVEAHPNVTHLIGATLKSIGRAQPAGWGPPPHTLYGLRYFTDHHWPRDEAEGFRIVAPETQLQADVYLSRLTPPHRARAMTASANMRALMERVDRLERRP